MYVTIIIKWRGHELRASWTDTERASDVCKLSEYSTYRWTVPKNLEASYIYKRNTKVVTIK